MDTARYLRICQTVLNLPLLLRENSSLGANLKELGYFNDTVGLEDGYTLRVHLDLLYDVYEKSRTKVPHGLEVLRRKRLISYEELVDAVHDFSGSRAYQDLNYEVQQTTQDPNRPHKYLGEQQLHQEPPPQVTHPEIPSPENPSPNPPENPAETDKKSLPDQKQSPIERYREIRNTRPNPQTPPTPQNPNNPPIKIGRDKNLSSFLKGARERLSFQRAFRTPSTSPRAQGPRIFTSNRQSGKNPSTLKARVPLSRRIPKPPPLFTSPAKNLISQAKVQFIRHPNIMTSVLSGVLGGVIGSFFGGGAGSAGGAVLGAISGPSIVNRVMNFGTPGGEDEGSGGGGGGGSEGGYSFRNPFKNPLKKRAEANARRRAARRARLLLLRRASMLVRALPLLVNLPWVLGIILLFIIVFLAFGFLTCAIPFFSNCSGQPTSIPGGNVTIEKIGPMQVQNDEDIKYQIIVTNKEPKAVDLLITDKIPDKTTYVSGDNDATPGGTGVTEAKWTIKGLGPNQSRTLNLTVKPIEPDIWVVNQVLGSLTNGSNTTPGQIPGGGDEPPSEDNCAGKIAEFPTGYKFTTELRNFGDPKCTFSKDGLYALLQQSDPANADYWFHKVIKCESGYNPNVHARHEDIGTPDPAGAWGLYQMGRGRAGQYDHGDVPWQSQTKNAISHNNLITNIGLAWRYWACAQDRW